MNRFAAFAKKYRLSTRELAAICTTHDPALGHQTVSKSSVHRLLNDRAPFPYLVEIEPVIVRKCRDYLLSIGKTPVKAAIEVPEKDFLSPMPDDQPKQFIEKITVPSGWNANYVFKDRNGKTLAVHVFNV